jgi:hypothetical protein
VYKEKEEKQRPEWTWSHTWTVCRATEGAWEPSQKLLFPQFENKIELEKICVSDVRKMQESHKIT